MTIRIFTASSASVLEEKVNKFLANKDSNKIKNISYSMDKVPTNYDSLSYFSVMIAYEEN